MKDDGKNVKYVMYKYYNLRNISKLNLVVEFKKGN